MKFFRRLKTKYGIAHPLCMLSLLACLCLCAGIIIYALANLLTKIPNTVVRVIDVIGSFDKPILDIKLFQEDLRVILIYLNL